MYEDELCVAFRDIAPTAPVHVLLVPRKPIPDIASATAEDAALLAHLMLKVGEIARAEGLSENGFRTVMNTGGQTTGKHRKRKFLPGQSHPLLCRNGKQLILHPYKITVGVTQ